MAYEWSPYSISSFGCEWHLKDPKLAQRAMGPYYEHNCINRVHLCGLSLISESDYAFVVTTHVSHHINPSFTIQKASSSLQNNRVPSHAYLSFLEFLSNIKDERNVIKSCVEMSFIINLVFSSKGNLLIS